MKLSLVCSGALLVITICITDKASSGRLPCTCLTVAQLISSGKDEATARELNKQCTSRCLSPEESKKLLTEELRCKASDIVFDCEPIADKSAEGECLVKSVFRKEFEELLKKTNMLDVDQYAKLETLVSKTAKGRGSHGKNCEIIFEY